jgi:hypothetical protein
MSLLGNRHQILELAQKHRFRTPVMGPVLAEWAGSQFGGMIIPIFENAKTIDSINIATLG